MVPIEDDVWILVSVRSFELCRMPNFEVTVEILHIRTLEGINFDELFTMPKIM